MLTDKKEIKCRCGNTFEPVYRNGLLISRFCYQCLIKKGREKQRKEANKEKREAKERMKTHSEWLNDLQKVFNTYIRKRDRNKLCISCGRSLTGKFDAGHYFTVGAYPNLRFNEDNVHGQCVECNMHRHGNVAEYSLQLPLRIGIERFEKLLETRNQPLKLTTAEIKELIVYYKKLTKELKQKKI